KTGQWVDIPQDAPALNPQELAALFKKKFVRSLKYLKTHGKLDVSHLPEDESFDDWLAPIAAKNWIADAQITPDCLATKEQCSVYLSEYVQGTAISDTRMAEDDEEQCWAKPLDSFSLEGESSAARRG
ncbi:MAG: transposase, partial [Pirellula sp.]